MSFHSISFLFLSCAFSFSLYSGIDEALAAGDQYLSTINLDENRATDVSGDVPPSSGAYVACSPASLGIVGSSNGYLVQVNLLRQEANSITGSTPDSTGQILAVDINAFGEGIAVGRKNGTVPYTVLISPSGSATDVTGITWANPAVASCSINDSGVSLAGTGTSPYLVRISPSGSAATATGISTALDYVAISNSGNGIVGGNSYLATVNSNGQVTPTTGDAAPSFVNSLDLNDSDVGVVSGDSGYLAKISPDGVVTKLTNSAGAFDDIFGVAINNAGEVVAGGDSSYLALFSPVGVETVVTGDLPSTTVTSVDMDDSGIAIAGGNSGYLALISPTGVAFQVSGVSTTSAIESVAIAKSAVVPSSPGAVNAANNVAVTAFAASSQALPNHALSSRNQGMAKSGAGGSQTAYLVDADDVVQKGDQESLSPHFQRDKMPGDVSYTNEAPYAIWFSPFGNYAKQKKVGSSPDARVSSVGGVLGFDYRGIEDVLIGTGVSYAFNYISVGESAGHAGSHQGMAFLYSSWTRKYFYINGAIWGGGYSTDNVRHSLGGRASSYANIKGGLLVPHLEMSTPFYAKTDWCIVDPFVMFDWANNWQGSMHEQGSSGFNINIGSTYMSLLRTELGFRFFERVDTSWGSVSFTEKLSYVNKKPFYSGNSTAFFTGSLSTFGLDVFSNQVQNLGVVQFSTEFTPKTTKYPYGGINYQGEFGTSFQTHFCSVEIGKNF